MVIVLTIELESKKVNQFYKLTKFGSRIRAGEIY